MGKTATAATPRRGQSDSGWAIHPASATITRVNSPRFTGRPAHHILRIAMTEPAR